MTQTLPEPRRLASALVDAARTELELTPKPGLVDRLDNGSHPDLSFELMARSIDLLPRYFEDLLEIADRDDDGTLDLPACVEAGRQAEARMVEEIGTNAHRGYIFLGGLTLLGNVAAARSGTSLRHAIAALAAHVLPRHHGAPGLVAASSTPSHGADLRRRLGIGGIHEEALAGLPAVFDEGLPALARAAVAGQPADHAHHYLMATLMTSVEDTTAVHRCGPEGLERLRRDGTRVKASIEQGADYLPLLAELNDEYRAMNLTMGGVADCMAVTLALWAGQRRVEP
jgi:triphosphoribosyl-dephospho-CoA synthase